MAESLFLGSNVQGHSVLVDLSLFPEIKNQGNIPMCASVAVGDLLAFHCSRIYAEHYAVDCFQLHDQVCGDLRVPPAERLNGALDLWKRGLIDVGGPEWSGDLSIPKPKTFKRIDSTDPAFEAIVQEEINRGYPVILDMPLMLSAIESLSTGVFPSPHSINNDRRMSRHVVLIVGYRETTETNAGAWIVRNCWGVEWGAGGIGLLPFEASTSKEVLKVTIVRLSA